ncbi:MAG: hypothetical protein JXO48_03625 [Deltaproteobacteria bacterium]|nr:hypothetical protein [Deltaproteobacteria bacterium]
MESDNIREAILKKARGEAEAIIKDAESRAGEIISRARGQKEEKLKEAQKKIIGEARREEAKMHAQASLQARQQILREKDEIIKQIVERVKKELSGKATDRKILLHLIRESLEAFGSDDTLRVLAASKDLNSIKEVVAEENGLGQKITEVKESDMLGGVMIETLDGMVSIDNTFDMRLEMLMPKILPEVGKKLFGS